MKKPACVVYIACRMTGRDRKEMVSRALHVCWELERFGLTPISPVLEEGVTPTQGTLVPASREELKGNWTRDKYIIRRMAHVVLLDGADEGSIGMSREYGLNRYCLWKPTVVLWGKHRGLTVADFEDDLATDYLSDAIDLIVKNFSTPWKRRKWRIKMLLHSLPKWCIDQLYAWR